MRAAYIAAGAGKMYCGSCLRDNRLAATLIDQGRDLVLVPVYMPLRTDETPAPTAELQLGGIDLYLSQRFPSYQRVPRILRAALNGRHLLRWISRWIATSAADPHVGALTVSVLQGMDGPLRPAIEELLTAIEVINPQIVNLPDLFFSGIARAIASRLDVPVLCTLSGEDLFLHGLAEPHRSRSLELIRASLPACDGFLAVTNYYASAAQEIFSIDAQRIDVVPLGVRLPSADDLLHREVCRTPRIGYFARICPEKGLDILVDAFVTLRRRGIHCELWIAGYVGPEHRRYARQMMKTLKRAGFAANCTFLGTLDHEEKDMFFRSIDLFSVPAAYPEAKGLSILEAMSYGVPVVQPALGSYPELIQTTGGGMLYPADQLSMLEDQLAELIQNEPLRTELGRAGREGVASHFTDEKMAELTWRIYARFVAQAPKRVQGN